MLTRSKKRTLAGICRLVTLPTTVLRSIGSFLTTYECFVAVRACKNNEGLKALLTSIEKIKIIRDNVLSGFVSVIEPSLISSIGCSVKVLEVQSYRDSGGALVQLLPRLGSLQHFQISLEFNEMRFVEQVFRSIPQRVRCLTLGSVDAEALQYLGEAATTGCLPVLEELAFPSLIVQTVEGMAGLQTALMAPSVGKNLKKLSLEFRNSSNHLDWGAGNAGRLLDSVLHLEDPTHGILSRLETLVLTCFTDWGMLAEYLLHGERLPGLKEVYSPDEGEGRYAYNYPGIAWYEMDSQVCRSWFELLHRRPLQTFNRSIFFFASIWWNPEGVKERILDLFRGLSNRALKPKCVAAIKEVDLTRKARKHVRSDTFEELAGAIRSGNLRSVESLALGALTPCASQSLTSLGKALDHAFLPCLTSFFVRIEEGPHHGYLRRVELEKWSLLLNSFFGSIPNGGLDNLQKFELQMTFIGTGMLLGALAEARPNCFRHLPELCLSGVSGEGFNQSGIMEKMALVFEAGIFPCVERVKISREDAVSDFGEGMPRLLRALSDYTNIKELHVEELFDHEPMWQIARPLLESMLTLLSVSTPSGFLSSLQILKITITDDDDDCEPRPVYSSDNIERLLLSIKAVRPPNLKTIILGESGGEKRI